jgi:hypothetical protein
MLGRFTIQHFLLHFALTLCGAVLDTESGHLKLEDYICNIHNGSLGSSNALYLGVGSNKLFSVH